MMFVDRSNLLLYNPNQLYYGMAVSDIDGDGQFEILVAGFNSPNLVLKWTGLGFENVASEALADVNRHAICLVAADIDADGLEEIYVLNADTFSGKKRQPDRLFDYVDGEWVDLFSYPMHRSVRNLVAGRSAAAIDRLGAGRYGFVIASYGGALRLYELDEDGQLQDVAGEAALNYVVNGRSLITAPIITSRMDIFCGNDVGANLLFINNGDGTFTEVGTQVGIDDPLYDARGAAILDANHDGMFDILLGNWQGPHRFFMQKLGNQFVDYAPLDMARPSKVRTVLIADFDNDGYDEIFFNNIGEPNRLFGYRDKEWLPLDSGAALEVDALGTGAICGDFDHDGRLELLISHGESAPSTLSYFKGVANKNNYLRVLPRTQYGAPARGALVTLHADGRTRRKVIDAGSGYLCQMEPIAHFGLGTITEVDYIRVQFPDGREVKVNQPEINQVIEMNHPDS